MLLQDFSYRRITTAGGSISFAIGGSGPPLLLLHGYPQTHLAWHRVAPMLAREFTVVAPDLRGYGDSGGRDTTFEPASFSKRAMALDQVELMQACGFDHFAVVGHDRGGRVAYRLALDHPKRVNALVSLTVIPTLEVWARTSKPFAMGAWHWFFFAQPFDLPERLIGADPGYFFDWTLRRMAKYFDRLSPEAITAYRSAFLRPDVRRAIFADYRAGATVDEGHDREDRQAGRRLACPVFVTWEAGRYSSGDSPVDIWRSWADEVDGGPIDAGHLQAEEAPEDLLTAILPFLRLHGKKAPPPSPVSRIP
ncbi:haloacetate dehalogenase [Enhydrobacter aerosaccus]|uniref:Haloacetate dehalogenase n=1 Tax=Enhydrobacter aerosaccus TaxID=225324 RepID=A0A1T4T5Z3_9HYPH|nr:alpha/beta hydrolase [Enhydrobacter aerosaccus]SKA35862.1 haloacetate dehalogenase [Enhydrobacter aerosaccus]